MFHCISQRTLISVALLYALSAAPACAQRRIDNAAPPPLQLSAAVKDPGGEVRRSPGWARFTGGFVTGVATMGGLMAATWDDPDAIPDVAAYLAFALGTATGTALTTAIWEKPKGETILGAAIGALPLLIAMNTDDDSSSGTMLSLALLTAPLGAAIGQRR